MFARTYSATTMGVEGIIIAVEVDNQKKGLPQFEITGMPSTAVKESKSRVRTAIRNSGINIPSTKVVVNLAPASLKKDSSGLDLAMAVALLATHEVISVEVLENSLFIGELSLEGTCKGVSGILPMVIKAKEYGLASVFVSEDNVDEALLVDGIAVYKVDCLKSLINHLQGKNMISAEKVKIVQEDELPDAGDFSEIHGQYAAKRAFEVAAAGGHNLIMIGSPGSGKSMMAKRMSSILPPMEDREALEVTKIYSVAGMLKKGGGLITRRPFRSPHHSISVAAMVGGGNIPHPGEITLSHNGVLFLDELLEFNRAVLESLRQPLEDGKITISRVNASYTFPSKIMLICGANPCRCGKAFERDGSCTCTASEIRKYSSRLSGPMMDRFDIQIVVRKVSYQEMTSKEKEESSEEIRSRVVAARRLQQERFAGTGIICNAQMDAKAISEYCAVTEDGEQLLKRVFEVRKLSARSYTRILKLARTIADLDNSKIITASHIGEAVGMRHDMSIY